jgi:hypothetical protein
MMEGALDAAGFLPHEAMSEAAITAAINMDAVLTAILMIILR